MMMMAMTHAKTGRSRKNLDNIARVIAIIIMARLRHFAGGALGAVFPSARAAMALTGMPGFTF